MAALLLAVLPFWIVLIEWLRPHGKRPGKGVVAGLVVGEALTPRTAIAAATIIAAVAIITTARSSSPPLEAV